MQIAFHIAIQALGFLALAAFIPAFVAGFALSRHDERLQKERAEPPGFRLWPKRQPAPKVEDYPIELRRYWIIRDRCLKGFALCIGLIVFVLITATVMDVPTTLTPRT